MLNGNSNLFNISSESELEALFKAYASHLESEHHLPCKHLNKLKNKFAIFLGAENHSTLVSMVNKGFYSKASASIQPISENTCIKCKSSLDELGYCTDKNCEHYHYLTQEEVIEVDSDIIKGYSSKKRIVVFTNVRSDDSRHNVDFDSAQYFKRIVDESLTGRLTNPKSSIYEVYRNLLKIDFSGDYAADEVAEEFADYNGNCPDLKRVSDMFNDKHREGGFEVAIDDVSLMRWLENYAPSVAKKCSLIKETEFI